MNDYRVKLFQPYVNQAARMNVMRVLSGQQIAEGPEVKSFEEEFAKIFGFEPWQVVSLNSGTSALELAYELAGIGPGDQVITPVLTCTATNLPLVRRKAKIIFADVQGPRTLNQDHEDVERKITGATRAIIGVQFGGNSEGIERISGLARERNIPFICDSAQALGAELPRDASFIAVSLQAIKTLTAGDGGVLICRERDDAARARRLRWFGYDREEKQRLGDTDLIEAGYKYHMNDISAAIVRGNLEDWDTIVEYRKRIGEIYRQAYYAKWMNQECPDDYFIAGIWNPQVVGIPYSVMKPKMDALGVQIGQYHYPNYKYSVFKDADADCPKMRSLEDSYFMLPCHMGVSEQEATFIAKMLWSAGK